MPPRANIRHVISSVAPPEAEAGDEWWDVGTNKYYKYAIVSGSSPQWVEMAQQTVLQTITGTLVAFVNNLLIQDNTWTGKNTFVSSYSKTPALQITSTYSSNGGISNTQLWLTRTYPQYGWQGLSFTGGNVYNQGIYQKSGSDDTLYFGRASLPYGQWVDSLALDTSGNITVGSKLDIGNLSSGIPYFSSTQLWSKRGTGGTLPNQTMRWTWYADNNSSIVGDRTLQLWGYPTSSAVPSSLAIFDQWLNFYYPTFTETSISITSSSSLTIGQRYIVSDLGTTGQAMWKYVSGSSSNLAVGSWFNAVYSGPPANPVGTRTDYSTVNVANSVFVTTSKNLYVINTVLTSWAFNEDGSLGLPTTYTILGTCYAAVTDGSFLYLSNTGTYSGISVFPIYPDGTLGTRTDHTTNSTNTRELVLTSNALYAINYGSSNGISYFQTSAYTGLVPYSKVDYATYNTSPASPVVNNGYIYLSNILGLYGVSVFPINANGTLGTRTEQSSTISANNYPQLFIVNNYLYAPLSSAGVIHMYPINADGSLGTQSSYSTLSSFPSNLQSNGNSLYCINFGYATGVSRFPINSNGTLGTRTDYTTFNSGTNKLIINNSGLYTINSSDPTGLSRFPINTNGTLGTRVDYATLTNSTTNVIGTSKGIYLRNSQQYLSQNVGISFFPLTEFGTGTLITQSYTRQTTLYTDFNTYGNIKLNNNNSLLLSDTTGYTPYLTCQNDNNLILYSTETAGIASNVDVNGNYPSGQTKTFLVLMWDNAGVAQITWTPTSSKLLFRVGQSVTITGDWNASSSPAYTQAQIKAAINTTQIVTESTGNYIKFVTSITGYPGIIYFANQQSPGSYVTNASIVPASSARAAFALIARDSTSSLQLLPGGGNVGIGTSSPVAALHVKGYDYTGTTTQSLWTTIKVEGSSVTTGAALVLNNWQIAGRGSNNPPASGLSFYDTNTPAFRMVIDSSGQVGIGTTSPDALLHIESSLSTGNTPYIHLKNSSGATPSTYGPGIIFDNNVTSTSPFILTQYQSSSSNLAIAKYGSPYTMYFSVSQTGVITHPQVPYFYATHSNSTLTTGIIIWGNSVTNNGNYYNTSTGKFTAPIAGYYFFRAHTLITYASAGEMRMAVYVNSAKYNGSEFIQQKVANTWNTLSCQAHCYLAANDTVYIYMVINPGTLYNDAGYNSFSGHLIG